MTTTTTDYPFTPEQRATASRLDADVFQRDVGIDGWRQGSRFVDRAGRAITFGQWAVMYEDNAYRAVRLTGDGFMVSTIWMGIDRRPPGDARPPLIFETMVFALRPSGFTSAGPKVDATEAAALTSHAVAVDAVKQWRARR